MSHHFELLELVDLSYKIMEKTTHPAFSVQSLQFNTIYSSLATTVVVRAGTMMEMECLTLLGDIQFRMATDFFLENNNSVQFSYINLEFYPLEGEGIQRACTYHLYTYIPTRILHD